MCYERKLIQTMKPYARSFLSPANQITESRIPDMHCIGRAMKSHTA